MKKLLGLIILSTLISTPSIAGGPDVRKLPEIRTLSDMRVTTRSERQMIEPIKENDRRVTAEKSGMKQPFQEEAATRIQPSYGKPEKIVERVVIREPEAKKKFPVLFESNPSSADVVVNGLYVGSTPVQIPLTDGVYNVRIALSNHDVWEQQIKAFQGLRVSAILQEGR